MNIPSRKLTLLVLLLSTLNISSDDLARNVKQRWNMPLNMHQAYISALPCAVSEQKTDSCKVTQFNYLDIPECVSPLHSCSAVVIGSDILAREKRWSVKPTLLMM